MKHTRWSMAVVFTAAATFAACGQVTAEGNFAGGVDIWDAGASAPGGTGGTPGTGGSTGTGGATGTGGSAGTGGATGTGGAAGTDAFPGVPCDVAQVFASHCSSCHGAAGTQAPRLASRTDLLGTAPSGGTWLAESLARMKNAGSPMPPAYVSNPVSAAGIAAVEAYVNGGAPATTCGAAIDAGTPPDAGPYTPPPASDAGLNTYADLPCTVAQVLASKCSACHGPAGTQAPRLVTRTDLLAVSGLGGMEADRCVVRMQAATNPMPPTYAGNPATAADIAAMQAWIAAGNPVGTCTTAIDAGVPVGPFPTTCASNSTWTQGNNGSSNMNPGLACAACHTTQSPGDLYAYMGTVFPSLHEKDRCNSRPPTGVTIEILNAAGAVTLTMTPKTTSGNFYGSRFGAAGSYRARVKLNGAVVAEMMNLVTNGDCNTCHTEQGAQGAPGRIVY